MIDYTIINNQELRELVMNSVSIQSLAEEKVLELVQKISQLPEDGQAEMMAMLGEEKRKVTEENSTNENQQNLLMENLQKIAVIKKGLQKDVLVEEEKTDRENSEQIANNLINKI